ncbi:MAG: YitT family protein [Bacteroidaceae bacterium]|nr:YitT family protein [Bacteroidaceae bacterium]
MASKKNPRTKKILRYIRIYSILVLASFVAAFGVAVFLTPVNIITGGITAVGIILNYYLEPLLGFDTNSLVSGILQVVLILVGWLVLGKDFGLRTFIASILYMGFYALLLEFKVGELMGLGDIYAACSSSSVTESAGVLALMSIAGGALVGLGVAFTIVVGGSTGGTDILAKITAKFTKVKTATSMFILDAVLIIVGLIVYKDIMLCIVGVISAFLCAMATEFICSSMDSFLVVDIISDKYKEIQEYVHTKMENNGHASTLIHAQGGYSGVEKEMLRVVIFAREETKFRAVIYSIDPTAFIVVTRSKSTHGTGFDPLVARAAYKEQKVTKRTKNKSVENIDEN